MSVRGTKKIIHEILQGATTESEEVQQLMIESVHSADYKEGVAAFLENGLEIYVFITNFETKSYYV